jgi:dolichyl-phosphate-mannose-protein mannosyltransferase
LSLAATPVPSALGLDEAAFLKRLMVRGFLLRCALAIVLDWTGYSELLAPDEGTYAGGGWALALYWLGELLTVPRRFMVEGAHGYFYVNGVLYYLFGFTDIPIKLINAFLGVLVTRHVFFLSRDLFGPPVARTASLLANYFPSLILWSALNIRDIWVILLLVLVSKYSFAIVRGYSHTDLVKLCAGIYALSFFRDYLIFAVAFPPVAAILLGGRGHLLRNFFMALLAAVAVAVLLEQGVVRPATQRQMSLEALSDIRSNLATGGSAYYTDVDISTPGAAITFLPIALAYFFFSPFPWQITSFLRILSVPEMLVVYWLALPTFRGLKYAVRYRLADSLQVLLLTALLTITYALTEGNVGTLYRHRAQAMAFYLIFAAVGLELRKPRDVATRRVAA